MAVLRRSVLKIVPSRTTLPRFSRSSHSSEPLLLDASASLRRSFSSRRPQERLCDPLITLYLQETRRVSFSTDVASSSSNTIATSIDARSLRSASSSSSGPGLHHFIRKAAAPSSESVDTRLVASSVY